LGGNNKKAKIVLKVPLAKQLSDLVTALSPAVADTVELLFQLRKFYFSEGAGKGYCYLRASIYSKMANIYRPVGLLDTVIIIGGIDATAGVLKRGSRVLSDFVISSLTKVASDSASLSFVDIQNIDNIEKRNLYLYMFNKFVDGLYFTYNAFSKQAPDKEIEVEMQDDKI
jgi:hypothetical protein